MRVLRGWVGEGCLVAWVEEEGEGYPLHQGLLG